jgi:hypothetical protein
MSNFIWVAGLSERAWTKSRKSYSSHAEDLIIDSIISRHQFMTGEKINFSYLDIGAWRPIRGSNTYKFYKNGIRGTVVEPNPNLVNLWKSIRPKDQFIESACSQKKSLKLFEFGDLAASNSSNIKFVKFIMKIQKLSKPTAIKVKGMKLQEIIEKHIEKFPGKFLLDLDIEGEDEVTILNHKFTDSTRPLIILVEDHFQNGILKSKIAKYLDKNDFALVGRSVITSIFVDKKSQLKDSQIWI